MSSEPVPFNTCLRRFSCHYNRTTQSGLWSLVKLLNSMDLLYRCFHFLLSGSSSHPVLGTMITASIIPVSQLCNKVPHSLLTSHLLSFNSWSNGKSSRTVPGTSHPSCQWVLLCSICLVDQWLNWHSEFIGKLDKFPYSLVVKFSDNVNSRPERKLDSSIRDEQHLAFTQNEW